MNCRKIKRLFPSFIDNDLSEELEARIEEHFSECADCRKEWQLLVKSWNMLDTYVTPELKSDFTPSLIRRIQLEQTKTADGADTLPLFRFLLCHRVLSTVLASLLIVVVTVSLLWKKPAPREKISQVTSNVPVEPEVAVTRISDKEIIRNLDIYNNIEILENFDLLTDLDVIEDWQS